MAFPSIVAKNETTFEMFTSFSDYFKTEIQTITL